MSAATEPAAVRFTPQSALDQIKNNPIFVAIALLVVVTSVREPRFLTPDNFQNIVLQFGNLIFAALGMTFVIMAGFLDLSIGGIISLVAVITVTMIDKVGQGPASDTSIFTAVNSGGIGPVSVVFLMFLVGLAVLYVIERRTYMGRAVVLTGGNKVAARLAGIPISKSIVMIYAISGLLSAIGAVVLVSRVTLADPTMGTPWMTQAILAVVVGGTALVGEAWCGRCSAPCCWSC